MSYQLQFVPSFAGHIEISTYAASASIDLCGQPAQTTLRDTSPTIRSFVRSGDVVEVDVSVSGGPLTGDLIVGIRDSQVLFASCFSECRVTLGTRSVTY
jgi:hypothetical protein